MLCESGMSKKPYKKYLTKKGLLISFFQSFQPNFISGWSFSAQKYIDCNFVYKSSNVQHHNIR